MKNKVIAQYTEFKKYKRIRYKIDNKVYHIEKQYYAEYGAKTIHEIKFCPHCNIEFKGFIMQLEAGYTLMQNCPNCNKSIIPFKNHPSY